jgi:hypothetical protein
MVTDRVATREELAVAVVLMAELRQVSVPAALDFFEKSEQQATEDAFGTDEQRSCDSSEDDALAAIGLGHPRRFN